VSGKDQKVLDGIALTSDAYDAGQLEALKRTRKRAKAAQAEINRFVADLEEQIRAVEKRRREQSF
jgi:hypothetical protein